MSTFDARCWYGFAMFALIALTIALSAALPRPVPFEPKMLAGTALSPAISHDGKTMLFTRQSDGRSVIMESHRTADGWSPPRIAAFSGRGQDMDPAFGPDDAYVIFASSRSAPDARGKTTNLWRVSRRGETWGRPVHLPSTVNISPDEFAPSIASDGTLYFLRSSAAHEHQLERARYEHGTYLSARALPFSSPSTRDADPLVAPDQSFVLFVSSGRSGSDDHAQHIYIVRADGASWGPVTRVRYRDERRDGSACCLTFGPRPDILLFTAGNGNESNVFELPIPR